MVTLAATLGEQRVVLQNISWETYERLLAEMGENRGTRLTYDQGYLEIMSPLLEHENPKELLSAFVGVLVEELNLEVVRAGSTTLKRSDLVRGSEPDSSFYIQNERLVRGKKKIDLAVDPPPDLVIEVDITSSSLNRESIYASLGIPEIWRYNGQVLEFLLLREGTYQKGDRSLAFPLVSLADLTLFLQQSQSVGETTLLRSFRTWVKAQIESASY